MLNTRAISMARLPDGDEDVAFFGRENAPLATGLGHVVVGSLPVERLDTTSCAHHEN